LSANVSGMFKPAGQHTRSIRKMMQSQPQHTVSETAHIRVQTVLSATCFYPTAG
ncbi:hypothetical protein KIL84_018151, partial [Mauremys mutica]